MTNYIWGGATGTMVGRFGPLTKGDVVALTDEEVATVAGNALWAPKPASTDRKQIVLDADATLTNDQSGVRIIDVKTSAIDITLPAAPTLGINYEFDFGPGAVGDITLVGNGKEIDGEEELEIAITLIQKMGVYYNGTQWVSYLT